MTDCPGDRIPGSRLVRDYCCRCQEPMRVEPSMTYGVHECLDCVRVEHPGENPMGIGTPRSEIEYQGSRFHAGEW